MQQFYHSIDNIKIKVTDKDAIVPVIRNDSRIISFYMNKDYMIMPNKREILKLGFIMSFDKEHVLLIKSDPQLAKFNGLYVIQELIEPSVKNEFSITLENTLNTRATLSKGQKIAEAILVAAPYTVIQVVKELE